MFDHMTLLHHRRSLIKLLLLHLLLPPARPSPLPTHTPVLASVAGHGILQARPTQPSWQRQLPSARHVPWPEHLASQFRYSITVFSLDGIEGVPRSKTLRAWALVRVCTHMGPICAPALELVLGPYLGSNSSPPPPPPLRALSLLRAPRRCLWVDPACASLQGPGSASNQQSHIQQSYKRCPYSYLHSHKGYLDR